MCAPLKLVAYANRVTNSDGIANFDSVTYFDRIAFCRLFSSCRFYFDKHFLLLLPEGGLLCLSERAMAVPPIFERQMRLKSIWQDFVLILIRQSRKEDSRALLKSPR